MKKIFLTSVIIFFPFVSFAYTNPGKPTGFVNDFAKVLTVEQKNSLEQRSVVLKQTSGFEVVTVVVQSLEGDTIENYATKLFAEWGIGDAKKDTGLLVLVSIQDRVVRIETGYGTEGVVTDLQAGNIIRNNITPAFKQGDYYLGLYDGLTAITSILMNGKDSTQYLSVGSSANIDKNSGNKNNFDFFWIFFVAIGILNALAKILGKTKSWWLGGVLGMGIGSIIGLIWGFVYTGFGAIFIFTILGLIFDYFVSKNGGKGSSGGGFWIFPGMGGGGSGGGGFGGFGGGMSGGGGASGRW